MSSYATDLLIDLFNQFEENEEGIFFFASAEDGPITPVSSDCQELLEETARFILGDDSDEDEDS